MNKFLKPIVLALGCLLMMNVATAAERGSVKWCDAKEKQLARLSQEGAQNNAEGKKGKPVKQILSPLSKKIQEEYQQYCQ